MQVAEIRCVFSHASIIPYMAEQATGFAGSHDRSQNPPFLNKPLRLNTRYSVGGTDVIERAAHIDQFIAVAMIIDRVMYP